MSHERKRNPFTFLIIGMIKFYRYFISPYLQPRCRFAPTCSMYALDAIQQHGLVKGGQLALKRLCRCHPWGDSGLDPVPPLSQQNGLENERAT